jgi:hypothetical protein
MPVYSKFKRKTKNGLRRNIASHLLAVMCSPQRFVNWGAKEVEAF